MARSPLSVFRDVLTRMKSSPWRTKIVATPPVLRVSSSTAVKSRLSALPRYSRVGASSAPTWTERSATSVKGSGNCEMNSVVTLSVRPTLISWVVSSILRTLWTCCFRSWLT